MPLNVNVAPITIPPIVDSLDAMLSQYDVTIQSIPASVHTARHIIKKFRKQTEPWFLVITPAMTFSEIDQPVDEFDRSHRNIVRLTAITNSSMDNNPIKKLDPYPLVNEPKPIILSKNSLSIRPLYLELISTPDPYAVPRHDPIFEKASDHTARLNVTLSLILEVLRSNRSLIRTNLKE